MMGCLLSLFKTISLVRSIVPFVRNFFWLPLYSLGQSDAMRQINYTCFSPKDEVDLGLYGVHLRSSMDGR